MALEINVNDLSDTEIHIYEFILSNANRVKYMSIQELAKEANCSTASILRFCKHVKCNGYSEFKFRLREYLESREYSNSELGSSLSDLQNFFQVIATSSNFQNSITKAAKIISTKKLILFAGLGSSNIMSEYGALYFSYIFNLSFRIEDLTNYPVDYFPKELAKDACIIALSVSGNTEEVISYVRNFSTADCYLIAITENPDSQLAGIADLTIPYSVPMSYRGNSNLTTQVPALYIIEKLAREVEKFKKA